MQFSYIVDNNIPPLSWCINFQRGSSIVDAYIGADVYRCEEFFVEGCWAGDFSVNGLRDASVSAASGVILNPDSVYVSGTTNTLARLYALRISDQLWVSNSLAFILTSSGQRLKDDYLFYCEDFTSIINGLDKAKPGIPIEGCTSMVQLYYHCDLNISKDLNIAVEEKMSCPHFKDFEAYYSFLSNSLGALFDNAMSIQRVVKYAPIATLSKGYDSPTCAVLALKNGCNEAITFFDPDASDPHSDSGVDISRALGMKIHEVSRTAYRDLETEYEFLSVGTGGEDAFFAPLENLLHRRILVTGFHGDKVWDCNNPKVSKNIIRGDPSGADLEEFRLRVGFIHVAIPFFGCRSQLEIAAISNSNEMLAWRLNGVYDRPICRRICEGAGVERGSFGQRKMVMSRSFGSNKERLEWYFGNNSLVKFNAFAKRSKVRPRRIDQLLAFTWYLGNGLANVVGKISYRAKQRVDGLLSPLERYSNPLDESKLIFIWAISRQQSAYRKNMNVSEVEI